MTTILLCRHGESQGNAERRFGGHGPTPLTERGRAQARAVGHVLAGEGLDAIYASDLVRAVQTADEIAKLCALSPQHTQALRERSVGNLTGLTFEEAEAKFPEVYAALMRREWDACPPGGESHAQCAARVATFLDDILTREVGRRVLLVSHNLTIYHFVRRILGLVDHPQAPAVFFQIDACALSRFERLDSGVWKCVSLNERGHLKAAV
jgi:probable phosphoglycerate mutase